MNNAAFILFVLFINKCASNSSTKSASAVGVVASVSNSQMLFGFQLNTQLEASPGYAECKFEFKSLSFPPKTFIVRAKVGQRTVLSPFGYPEVKLSSIDCGDYGQLTKDVFSPENPLITLVNSRVQFIGYYELSSKNNVLSMQMKRNVSLDYLKRVAFDSGASWAGRLYSAYSSKQIQAGMLAKVTMKPIVVVQANAKVKNLAVESREQRSIENLLGACLLEERFRNPVVVGFLAMKVKYTDGKFDDFEKIQNQSTYSDKLIDCTKSKLKDHITTDFSISRIAFKI